MTGEHDYEHDHQLDREDFEQGLAPHADQAGEPDPADAESAFVLEDWDELDEVLAEVEEEVGREVGLAIEQDQEWAAGADFGEAASGGSPPAEDPEDVLFQPGPVRPSHRPTARSFDERGGGWAGAGLSPHDLGIPVDHEAIEPLQPDDLFGEGEEQQSDSGFFSGVDSGVHAGSAFGGEADAALEEAPAEAGELGGDSGFFRAGGSTAVSAVHEVELEDGEEADFGGESGFFEDGGAPSFGGWRGAPGRQAWASGAGHADEAPEEAAFAGDEAEQVAGAGAELPEYDYDEPFVASPAWAREERRRRRPLAWVAGLAALLVGGLAVGTWITKPEWLGMRATVLVERTAVARPSVDLRLAVPADVLPETSAAVEPPPDPFAAADPAPAAGEDPPAEGGQVDPVAVDPRQLEPDAELGREDLAELTPQPPAGAPPLAGDLALPTPGVEPAPAPSAAPAEAPVLVAVGEELQIGGQTNELEEAEAPSANARAADLVAGDQAFAELHNGNYFVGSVKALEADDITLRVEGGELTLPLPEVRAVGTLDSPDYTALQRKQPGFIRLTNQNRLRGTIRRLDSANVAVDLQSSRIIIPQSAIDEITSEQPTAIRVSGEDDAGWVQQLVEKRLQKQQVEADETSQPRR